MLRMLSLSIANLRSFAIRSSNLIATFDNTDEDDDDDDDDDNSEIATAYPRNTVFNQMERAFGRFLPIVLWAVVMFSLINCAIISTALYGNDKSVNNNKVEIPKPISGGEILSLESKPISTPPILFLGLSALLVMTSVYFLRLIRTNRASLPDNGSEVANATSASRARLNQLFAQLLLLDANLPSRLRLALMNRDFDGDDYETLLGMDEENQVSDGISENEITRLPTHTITQENYDANSDSLGTCSICLAPYEAGDCLRTVLCMHQFHVTCIDPWLRCHASCPVCKHAITES